MSEYPLFVPHGSEHLAAMVTMPEGDPLGLAVLVTGIGAPRSHRFQMWTVLARRLADMGLASIRFDYHGMGDSTGTALEWGPDWNQVLLAEVKAVAREGMRVTGARGVAVAGNCGGAELALRMAAEVPECVGAMCILLSVLQKTTTTVVRRRLGSSRLVKALRRVRGSARLLAKLVRGRRLERKMDPEIAGLLEQALRRARVFCLYGERDREYNQRVQTCLLRTAGGVRGLPEDRFEIHVIPETELGGFEAVALQQQTIDLAAGWMASTFRVDAGQPRLEVAIGRGDG